MKAVLEEWIKRHRKELDVLWMDSKVSHRAGFTDHPFSIEPWEAETLFLAVLEFKPQICIEFGAAYGFSALHIGKALSLLNNGKILAFELNEDIFPDLERNIDRSGLSAFVGPCFANCAHKEDLEMIPEKVDFVFLDRNAAPKDVLNDLQFFQERDCKLFFLHDTWSSRWGDPFKTLNGIQIFLKSYSDWRLELLSGQIPEVLIPKGSKHPAGSESLGFLHRRELFEKA